ncbi:MAG TPA: hypothetical protein VN947_14490 [Polyangia bacterium]|nr:hypothetical protein [Polyangia bacterium]
MLTLLLGAALVAGAGCRPDLGLPTSLVLGPRVAAVRFEPAEAAPGAAMTATAFVVTPDGAAMSPIDWSLCLTPKATSNNDVVDPACLTADGTMGVASGAAVPVPFALPAMGCRLFGPDTPPQMAGQPPLQSRAPDVTGGYYQPVRAALAGTPTIALARIRCALAGASFEVATEYNATYTNNVNPTLTAVGAFAGDTPLPLDAIAAGQTVTLAAGWNADSVESFPVLDPAAQVLVTHREAMTVSWFVSDGTIGSANTGRGENDEQLFTTTTWTAPATAGVAHLFVVLHDSRGGVDFTAVDLTVR